MTFSDAEYYTHLTCYCSFQIVLKDAVVFLLAGLCVRSLPMRLSSCLSCTATLLLPLQCSCVDRTRCHLLRSQMGFLLTLLT